MIAEKLEHQINWLDTLSRRDNGDLRALVGVTLERMRAEVARLRELETTGVLVLPDDREAAHGDAR